MSSRSYNSDRASGSRMDVLDEGAHVSVSRGGEGKPGMDVDEDDRELINAEEEETAAEKEEELREQVSVLTASGGNNDTRISSNEMRDSNVDNIDNDDGNVNDVNDGGPNEVSKTTFRDTMERLERFSSRCSNATVATLSNGDEDDADFFKFHRMLIEEVPYARNRLETQYKLICNVLDNNGGDNAQAWKSSYQVGIYVKDLNIAVNKVHQQLLFLAGRSQADPTQHSGRKRKISGSTSTYYSGSTGYKRDVNALPKRLEPDKRGGLGTIRPLKYFNEKSPVKHHISSFSDLDPKHQNVLKNFNRVFQDIIRDAEKVPKKKDKSGNANNESNEKKEAALDEHEKDAEKVPENGDKSGNANNDSKGKKGAAADEYKKALGNIEKKLSWKDSYLNGDIAGDTASDPTLLQFPSPLAEELPHVQPFLLQLLQSLGLFIEHVDSASRKETPKKNCVQQNRIMPPTDHRAKRVVDKTIAANGQFIFLCRDDLFEVSAEEKPWARIDSNQGPEELLGEVTSQTLSHLAKHVGVGFNFAGMGVDTKATGVILTQAYVKIIQLRLENMGRLEVELVQCETPCLPIMTRENFDLWLQSSKRFVSEKVWKKWTDFGSQLYDADAEVVPSGLVALSNLMKSTRADLMGADWLGVDGTKRPPELGDLLGFGSYATVYARKEQEGRKERHVIKLSNYGADNEIKHEASVLQKLSKACCPGIPRVVEEAYTSLSVKIGGVEARLPALFLEPKGISVAMHLASIANGKQDEEIRNEILQIGDTIAKALNSISEMGFCHNDVSPKNILIEVPIDKTDGQKGTAFLNDFGLATELTERIKGFRGTTSFTDRSVFGHYPSKAWNAEPKFDRTSLAYSMAVIANNGKSLWKPFQPFDFSKKTMKGRKDEFEHWADKRSEVAWSKLEEFGFAEKPWKEWCGVSDVSMTTPKLYDNE